MHRLREKDFVSMKGVLRRQIIVGVEVNPPPDKLTIGDKFSQGARIDRNYEWQMPAIKARGSISS